MPGQSSTHGRSGPLDSIENWMARRNADVQRLAAGAHAVGQQVWEDGNQLGRYVSAPRPSDVAALGLRAMQQMAGGAVGPGSLSARAGEAVARQVQSATPVVKRIASNASDEALAGLNGAQDAFTFGIGDRAYAGARALADAAQGGDLGRSYSRHYAGTQALDAYDEAHHPIARTVGQIAGTGAQIALTGGGEGLIAAGARIPQVSGLLAREAAAMGAGGALSGVGGQVISDVTGHRLGTPGDYGGAAIGGAAGVLATGLARGRATYGGAAEGAVTSTMQDLLNGRQVSIDRAREAAAIGGAAGRLMGSSARAWSNDLSNREKEQLGEALSRVRTASRGDWTKPVGKSRTYLAEGGYTYPDQRTYGGNLVESKFGLRADLSPRQRQAFYQPLLNYRVYHFLPADIGAALGLPAASLAYGLYEGN